MKTKVFRINQNKKNLLECGNKKPGSLHSLVNQFFET
jgi:hypothetical protein